MLKGCQKQIFTLVNVCLSGLSWYSTVAEVLVIIFLRNQPTC